jgi:hypothetical protein
VSEIGIGSATRTEAESKRVNIFFELFYFISDAYEDAMGIEWQVCWKRF